VSRKLSRKKPTAEAYLPALVTRTAHRVRDFGGNVPGKVPNRAMPKVMLASILRGTATASPQPFKGRR
jgi:hypothetical protein